MKVENVKLEEYNDDSYVYIIRDGGNMARRIYIRNSENNML